MMEQVKIGSYGGRIKWCLLVYFCMAVLFFWSLYPLQIGWMVPGWLSYLFGGGMLALAIYTLRLLGKQVMVCGGELLSFPLTGIQKYFWGLTLLAFELAVWIGLLLGWNRPQDWKTFVAVGCALGVFMLITCITWFLKVVYVREDDIYVSNYFKVKQFKLSEIRGLYAFNMQYFLVLLHNGRRKYYCFLKRVDKNQELVDDLKRRAWSYRQMGRKKF